MLIFRNCFGYIDKYLSKNEMEYKKSYRDLENLSKDDIDQLNYITLRGLNTKAKCIDVYDGDTVTIVVNFNNNYYKRKCRLYGIDSAEIRTKNEDEKKIAIMAKEYLSSLILDKIIWCRCLSEDKYGRTLIEIYTRENDMIKQQNCVSNDLIKSGYAYEYDGGKKQYFDDWFDLDNVSIM